MEQHLGGGWLAVLLSLTVFTVLQCTWSPGEGVCIAVTFAGSMLHLKVVALQELQPPSYLAFGFFETEQPCEGCVVGADEEVATVEVGLELVDGSNHGE